MAKPTSKKLSMHKNIYLRIKLSPHSSKNEIIGPLNDQENTIKVAVKAIPKNGKANEALIKLLAKEYHTSSSNIKIISGHTSQIKLIRIQNEPTRNHKKTT